MLINTLRVLHMTKTMTTPKRTGAKLRSLAGWVLPFEWAWPFDV